MKQKIEEQSELYRLFRYDEMRDNGTYSDFKRLSDQAQSDFQAGASFAISLFKWKKVSEELPEKREKQQVLVTNDIEDTIWVDVLPIHLDSHIDYIKQNYKYWMPIPQID